MKLTSEMLKNIIEEEVKKARSKDASGVKAKEVDADEFGKPENRSKHIDYAQALKLEQKRLEKRLKRISEERERLKKIIMSSI